eukprot:scaffold23497_cov106-Cylindrotheca_fusiformis.AAC.3
MVCSSGVLAGVPKRLLTGVSSDTVGHAMGETAMGATSGSSTHTHHGEIYLFLVIFPYKDLY